MVDNSPIPRVRAYLQHVEDRSVFSMPKDDWDGQWQHSSGSAIQFDLTSTPISRVATSASVIAAVAVRFPDTLACDIEIYRSDPKDEPTPVNLDRYSVLEDLSTHPHFPQIVAAASAQSGPELLAYLSDHVFIVKKSKGPDHWLLAVPASTMAVVKASY